MQIFERRLLQIDRIITDSVIHDYNVFTHCKVKLTTSKLRRVRIGFDIRISYLLFYFFIPGKKYCVRRNKLTYIKILLSRIAFTRKEMKTAEAHTARCNKNIYMY